MLEIQNPPETTFWIAYDADYSGLRHGAVKPNGKVKIDCDLHETFTDAEAWKVRFDELRKISS